MEFELSDPVKTLHTALCSFMDEVVYPNESTYTDQLSSSANRWESPPVMETMRAEAHAAGLWNLFLSDSDYGAGLTNVEYAPLCETIGRSAIAPEVFNCAAPDTGNMEVLDRYGTDDQKATWLAALTAGRIRSAYTMTEPHVASSDATNISATIESTGDAYILNGHKSWISGAGNIRCRLFVFLGKTDPSSDRYKQQSMILVPRDMPGVTLVRPLTVFGYDHAPHGHWEITFENVRVPRTSILLGEGHGFEIAQGRLGPGRIHHCMRMVGLAERSLEAMCDRARARVAFGKPLAERGVVMEAIANSRIEIEQARLLTLKAAHMMDTVGNKAARAEIAMSKVVAPNMAQRVVDRAIQVHGGAGVCDDFELAAAWTQARATRLFDGPDEVHRRAVAKLELRKGEFQDRAVDPPP